MKKKDYLRPATEVVEAEPSATLLAGSMLNEAETETTGVFEVESLDPINGLSRPFDMILP